jgi:enoyl-CoA hydratase/carnithine racemase
MSTVRFTEDGALGVIRLNSPPLNLIGEALIRDLVAALDQVESSRGIRALLLRGEGKAFSAWADVRLFRGERLG